MIGLICLLLVGCSNQIDICETGDSECIPTSEIKIEEEPYVTCGKVPLDEKNLCCTSKGFDGWIGNMCDFNITRQELDEIEFKPISNDSTTRFQIGTGLKVSEDMYCMGEERGTLCFAGALLIELEKGVYALNLPYYRQAGTSWEGNAIKLT